MFWGGFYRSESFTLANQKITTRLDTTSRCGCFFLKLPPPLLDGSLCMEFNGICDLNSRDSSTTRPRFYPPSLSTRRHLYPFHHRDDDVGRLRVTPRISDDVIYIGVSFPRNRSLHLSHGGVGLAQSPSSCRSF